MKNVFGFATWVARHAVVLLVAVSLAGCLEDDKDEDPSQPTEQPTNEPPPRRRRSTPRRKSAARRSRASRPASLFLHAAGVRRRRRLPRVHDREQAGVGHVQRRDRRAHRHARPTPTSATRADITISVTDGRDTRSVGPFKIKIKPRNQPPPPANSPPTISGVPANAVTINQAYSFQPSASDPNGDTLRFAISNRPSWASFSTSTGRLSGTPTAANIGTYSNIVICVNDGQVERRAAGVLDPGARRSEPAADDQRLAARQCDDGRRIRSRRARRDADKQPADVLDREQAGVGELQHFDRSPERHAGGGQRRQLREHHHQRERRPRVGVAAGVRDQRAGAAESCADDHRHAADQRHGGHGVLVHAERSGS